MSSPVGQVAPPPVVLPPSPPPPSGLFARKLAELEQVQPPPPPHVVTWLKQLNRELAEGEQAISAIIESAKAGKELSNGELLALQAQMYQYTILVDLTSKVITQLVNGLKELLKMQV